MIGPRTAEEIKMTIGSAYPLGGNELEMEVRGRDQVAGLPVTKRINSVEIRECLAEPIQQIIESVKLTLEKCPPELAADLVERGMVLAGGGALIKGIDKALIKETGFLSLLPPIHFLLCAWAQEKRSNTSINLRNAKRVRYGRSKTYGKIHPEYGTYCLD